MQYYKPQLNNATTYEMQFVGKQVTLPELLLVSWLQLW